MPRSPRLFHLHCILEENVPRYFRNKRQNTDPKTRINSAAVNLQHASTSMGPCWEHRRCGALASATTAVQGLYGTCHRTLGQTLAATLQEHQSRRIQCRESTFRRAALEKYWTRTVDHFWQDLRKALANQRHVLSIARAFMRHEGPKIMAWALAAFAVKVWTFTRAEHFQKFKIVRSPCTPLMRERERAKKKGGHCVKSWNIGNMAHEEMLCFLSSQLAAQLCFLQRNGQNLDISTRKLSRKRQTSQKQHTCDQNSLVYCKAITQWIPRRDETCKRSLGASVLLTSGTTA